MWHCVDLFRTDFSVKQINSIFRPQRIRNLTTTLAAVNKIQVDSKKPTQRYIPKYGNLHSHRHENIKS
jgi:hypothetical protein